MKQNVKTITPGSPSIWSYIYRIFQYRYLIYILALRDIKIRYSQTMLGWLWAFLQPLIGMGIFTFFFAYIVNIETDNIPYPLIALSGVATWNYFSFLTANGASSIIASQNLIKQITFPKICLILSKVIVGLIDQSVAILLLLLGLLFYKIGPSYTLLFIPVIISLNIIAGVTSALWLAALSLRYRDLQHVIPYMITFGIWLTPVFYPTSLIPEQLSFLNYLNPMALIIESMRYVILGSDIPDVRYLYGLLILLVLFISGVFYFKNIEKDIPDYI